MRHALLTVALPLLLLFTTPSPAAAQLPQPTGTVTDLADVLSPDTEQALRARIEAVEQKTSAEIAVAVVPSLDGMTVEDYAARLFKQWGIGQAKTDNGVLLLVAPTDRKVRIEVGYGLEPILPDGLAGDIIRNQALPAFRDGHFEQGIRDSLERIASIVEAKHVLTDEERKALDESEEGRPPALVTTGFFGLFIALGALALGMGFRTKTIFPLIWGGLFGGIPMIMALIPFFNVALWVVLPIAAGMFWLGWSKAASAAFRAQIRGTATAKGSSKKMQRGLGASTAVADDDDSWTMGGDGGSGSSSSSSGSSGSSSSSSSSFSGGSSGGGGASGSW